jgi:hypothetical protein
LERGGGYELGLSRRERQLIELVEELVLGVGDGLSVDCRDLGGGLCLLDSAFGFGGEEGAVALRLRVPFGDSGGNAGGTGFSWSGWDDVGGGATGEPGAAGAMGGEALGCLLLQTEGSGSFRFGCGFVQ